MEFIDRPLPHDLAAYTVAINSMTEYLSTRSGIVSIYQVGGVGHPGISDIDLFAVFEDGIENLKDPRLQLDTQGKYLFTHNLFGTSTTFFKDTEKHTLFGNYKLLWGEELQINYQLSKADESLLKRQIALEFMLRMYISLSVEHSFGLLKMRNFLLQAKGLLIDLGYMETDSLEKEISTLKLLCTAAMEDRDRWFDDPPSDQNMQQSMRLVHEGLESFFQLALTEQPLWVPIEKQYQISRNIKLTPSNDFHVDIDGFSLPSSIGAIAQSKRYFNLNNRLSQFNFFFPMQSSGTPAVITERFEFLKANMEYNAQYLPYYQPTTYGLNIF